MPFHTNAPRQDIIHWPWNEANAIAKAQQSNATSGILATFNISNPFLASLHNRITYSIAISLEAVSWWLGELVPLGPKLVEICCGFRNNLDTTSSSLDTISKKGNSSYSTLLGRRLARPSRKEGGTIAESAWPLLGTTLCESPKGQSMSWY